MITSAFLTKIIIYGLIAAVLIPAIDFVAFIIRESRQRRAGSHKGTSTAPGPVAGRVRRSAPNPPAETMQRPAPRSAPTPPQPYHPDNCPQVCDHHPAGAQQPYDHHPAGAQQPHGRHLAGGESPHYYDPINGVVITPTPAAGRPTGATGGAARGRSSDHPHAEYWTYGEARFYERN